MFRMRATREALIVAEQDLERITHDLRLPMLADIRRQLSEIRDEVVQHTPSHVRMALAAVNAADAVEGGEERQEQSEAAAAAAVNEEADRLDSVDEALMQKARDAIDRGMMARSKNGSTIREVISSELAKSRGYLSSHEPSEAGAAAAGTGDGKTGQGGGSGDESDPSAGSLIAHVRRVRLENLTQGTILGRGTFGDVYAGKYNGRDVAIKKARAPIYAKQTTQDFR